MVRNSLKVLGFSSGSSPKLLLERLSAMNQRGELSFKNVELFCTDEYFAPTDKEEQQRSYHLRKMLLEKVDIDASNIHIPTGISDQKRFSEYCAEFDERAKGLDPVFHKESMPDIKDDIEW